MGISGWLEAAVAWKVEWRCVSVACGGQCAVTCGEQQMQLWSAGNSAIPAQVRMGRLAVFL